MARSLHSDSLAVNSDDLHERLLSDLNVLKNALGLRKLPVLTWDDNRVAISLKLKVELPARGVYNNLDIKSVENILILFDKLNYPHTPPRVYSDRKSFPTEGISHLYVTETGKPVPLCLVRGNYKEWFANKLLPDLINQVRSWLRDAAWGMLDTDGEQYDPMRLEGYQGNIVYDHTLVSKIVLNKLTFEGSSNFTFLLLRENDSLSFEKDNIKYPSYELINVINKRDDLLKSIKPILDSISNKIIDPRNKRIVLGALIWRTDLGVDNRFPSSLPNDYNSLIDFFNNYKISASSLLDFLPLIKIPGLEEFPILVGINRPLPMIGYDSTVEVFNFYLRFHENAISDNIIVKNMLLGYQKHSQPLTISKAKQISGNSSSLGKVIQIGCGAVGSKFAIHMVREGNIDNEYLLFDNDKVEPHNVVRYGLLAESIGMNKSLAIAKAAYSLFNVDQAKIKILGLPVNGTFLFNTKKTKKLLNKTKWIFDFTASDSFENYLIEQKFPIDLSFAKAYIANKGLIGILLIEGVNRNPRVDDIKIIVQSGYRTDLKISQWLKDEYEDSKNENTLVNVGVGCNSETTILDDSSISMHSSSFFKSIKVESENGNRENGIAYLSLLNSKKDDYSFHTQKYEVKPLVVIEDPNSGWQLRIKNGLVEHMMSEMGKHSPIETGGVLIGLVNNKTQCIHITDIVLAPSDSMSNEVCFVRGIDGLKEEVDKHKKLSGQTFGYIGEWHSHPMGPFSPSSTDIKTMQKTKAKYIKDDLRMPVLMIIATPQGIIPCIY